MPRRADQGWILLDVLVGLAVLGMALAGFADAMQSATAAVVRAEDRQTALMVAQSVLARSAEAPLTEGVSRGTLAGGRAWQLSVQRAPANPTGPTVLPVLWHLSVRVATLGRPVVLETLVTEAGNGG